MNAEKAKEFFSTLDETPTAFPWTHDKVTCTGMTLRDYFAAAFVKSGTVFPTSFPVNTPERVAKQAYELADAMLQARKTDAI
jgi:hypothetical protein